MRFESIGSGLECGGVARNLHFNRVSTCKTPVQRWWAGRGGEKAESSKEKKKNKNMQDVVSIQIPDNPHSICPRIPADVSEHLRSN